MKKSHKSIGILPAVLLFIWAAVIFSFSFRSGTVSHGESSFVKAVISSFAKDMNLHINHSFYQVFTPFVEEKTNITGEVVIRKIAHFTEYFVFGVLCGIAAVIFKKRSKWWFIPLLFGFLVSFADEKIIQLFLVSGRTSSYMDILLDCIGFYSAVAICALTAIVIHAARRRKSAKKG